MFTHPRILSFLPWYYTHTTQQFLEEVQKDQALSSQRYWQFREFYSIGSFTFDPEIVTFGETQIIYALPRDKNTLLTYTSPRLSSTDFIVKIDPAQIKLSTETILKEHELRYQNNTLVFKNDSTRIWQDTEQKYVIVFVKPIEEMRKVNGFFDYTGPEQKLLKDMVWVNETHFW